MTVREKGVEVSGVTNWDNQKESQEASDMAGALATLLRNAILVVESDVTDNTKTICDNSKFIGITEMTIDVHLLYCLIGGGMSWH